MQLTLTKYKSLDKGTFIQINWYNKYFLKNINVIKNYIIDKSLKNGNYIIKFIDVTEEPMCFIKKSKDWVKDYNNFNGLAYILIKDYKQNCKKIQMVSIRAKSNSGYIYQSFLI